MSPRQTRIAWDAIVATLLLVGAAGMCAALAMAWPPAWLAIGSITLATVGLVLAVLDLEETS